MFKPNAIYETLDGRSFRVQVVLLDPPFAYGRQATIKFRADGPTKRVGMSALYFDDPTVGAS